MYKYLIILLIATATLWPQFARAQGESPYGYYLDALRFSQTFTGGSARIQALGGTNVALGADVTAISSNPAGLGLYNRSEISITPGFSVAYTNSTFNGNPTGNQTPFGQLANTGLVINNTKGGVGGWLGGSFGFSVNKINDFNNEFRYGGQNGQNSIVDYFLESANGFPAGNFPAPGEATDLTTLAYYTYLIGPWDVIDPAYPDDAYFSDITSFLRPVVRQQEVVKTRGGQYQWSLSYGGNLADILYLGFGLGIVSLNYEALKTYSEAEFDYSAEDPTYNPVNRIDLEESLKIKGTGFNGTFGFILRPVSFFRLGATITSPTFYNLNDTYNASLAADWNNFFYEDIVGGDTTLNYVVANTMEVASGYSLSTPFKASAGIAFIFGKVGFISADIDYLDYSKAWLNASGFSMDADNNYIRNNFSEAVNLKAGAEIRLGTVRLRGGYALNQVPVTADLNYRGNSQRLSLGVGLHLESFYADLAVINHLITSAYTPYVLNDNAQPVIDLKTSIFSSLLTLGYKF